MSTPPRPGRVAVVTGAAQGLGLEYAVRLAADGCRVAALDVREPQEAVDRVRAEGGEALGVVCDVSDESSVQQAAQAVNDGLGPCAVLVNNAGVSPNVPWAETDLGLWRRVVGINLEGQFLTARAFGPDMQQAGWGRIINVCSNTLGLAIPGFVAYMASKAGVVGLTRALATDLGADGITVNALSPGLTHTPTTDSMWEGTTLFSDLAAQQALKREAVPTDLAGVVSFLASDDAGWVTGQTLVVDGGLVRL